MYIDKYQINSYGTKYKGNKELKNKLLTSVKSEDGQRLRKMVAFLEEYEDLNHQYSSDIELIVSIKKNNESLLAEGISTISSDTSIISD